MNGEPLWEEMTSRQGRIDEGKQMIVPWAVDYLYEVWGNENGSHVSLFEEDDPEDVCGL